MEIDVITKSGWFRVDVGVGDVGTVGVGVTVAVGVGVLVAVGVGVRVGVAVITPVGVGVSVMVGVGVEMMVVGVGDDVGNSVGVGDTVGVTASNILPSSVVFVIFPTASRSYDIFASVVADFLYSRPANLFYPSY